MLAGSGIVVNPSLYKKLPYDPERDLMPVTQFFGFPSMLLVNNEVPARSVQELVELLKEKPARYVYGHYGIGTSPHLAMELFKTMAHVQIQGIAYRNVSQVATDTMNGDIPISFGPPGPLLPFVWAQKIRALAVSSKTRAPFASELPTMEELGYRPFDINSWYGVFLPAKTPLPIVDALNAAVVSIMKTPGVQKKLLDIGTIPMTQTPSEFAALIKNEKQFWAGVIKDAGVEPVE